MFRYGDETDQGCKEREEEGKPFRSVAHTEGQTTTLCHTFFSMFPSTAEVMQDGLDNKQFSLDNYETRGERKQVSTDARSAHLPS